MMQLRPSSGRRSRQSRPPSCFPLGLRVLTTTDCSPNRLVVDESGSDDNSVANINPATMETLQLFRGDTIIVRGKKRKDTG